MAFIIWMTGFPCSGKSTLAKKLLEYIPKMEILDGDELNNWLTDGWTKESRIVNTKRIAHVTKLLFKHNIPVCVSTISPYDEGRKAVSEIINDNRFIELFVKCSLEVCAKRDEKGMYKKARSGELDNFSGVTAPYEIPNNPELIIDTENNSIEDCVKDILNYLKSNNLLSPTI